MFLGLVATSIGFTSCDKDEEPEQMVENTSGDRWVTVAGALYGTNPGDGNGGTMVYSVPRKDIVNPDVSINVFDNGVHVKSSRTARLQASQNGNSLYNIQYTGADGGIFNKYKVMGGAELQEEGSSISTSEYVGTSPRWAKAAEGVGVAVTIRDIVNKFENDDENGKFLGVSGTAVIVVLDLDNPAIIGQTEFELGLSEAEQLEGHCIFRLDAPVLSDDKTKLYVGTWMRKYVPGTTTRESDWDRLGTKTLVVDYPSLANPRLITSTQATGDCSGYRSPMSHVGADGYVYQGTHREVAGTGGSKILRITPDGSYDNAYSISLDQQLGITDSYIESWKYGSNGKGVVIYSIVVDGERTGGYLAEVDLVAQTAKKIDIPNEATNDFGQYQGIAVQGDEVYIAIAGIGVDGNVYVYNTLTGELTTGAKLVNPAGNRYIGVY